MLLFQYQKTVPVILGREYSCYPLYEGWILRFISSFLYQVLSIYLCKGYAVFLHNFNALIEGQHALS